MVISHTACEKNGTRLSTEKLIRLECQSCYIILILYILLYNVILYIVHEYTEDMETIPIPFLYSFRSVLRINDGPPKSSL